MNIQAEKLEILKMVLDTENPSILQRIKQLFSKDKDFWNTLSDIEKEEILKGIEELDHKETYAYEDIMKNHRK